MPAFVRTSPRSRTVTAEEKTWRAPRMGWVDSEGWLGPPDEAAAVLDNVFPTLAGARLRRGWLLHATVDDPVVQIASYQSGTTLKLFACTETDIYDVTAPASATVAPTASLGLLTSGDWSFTQVSNAAGDFLVGVNGADTPIIYNGTSWQLLTTVATYDLPYDALVTAFAIGETITGGTSGATADVLGFRPSATAGEGTLIIGTVTGGPFQNNETITSAGGEATVNAGSGETAAGTITASGVTLENLSFVWSYKSRLYFVEKNTLNIWYTAVNALGGSLTAFRLWGVVNNGGSALYGGATSLDSGAGLGNRWVVVTTAGEAVVYEGSNPASDFELVTAAQIGLPLNKRSWFNGYGDFYLLTQDGVISTNAVLSGDRAAQVESALSRPIQTPWIDTIATDATYPFSVSNFRNGTMLMIGMPPAYGGVFQAFVMNTRTRAWCRFTGWDVRASVVHDGALYFGNAAGQIALADVAGSDMDEEYFGIWCPLFSQMNSMADKQALRARLVFRAPVAMSARLTGHHNYDFGAFEYPDAVTAVASTSVWDVGRWDEAFWDEQSTNAFTIRDWEAVAGLGEALSVAAIVGSNKLEEPNVELVSLTVQFHTGLSR